MSRGSLSCWDAYPIPQSTLLRSDLPAEEYLVEPSAGSVRRTLWSPHRIDLAADLQKPARVRINQNWHPGWRSSVGRVVNDDGLLALDLPSGSNDVRVRFLPRSGFGGAIGSVIAIGVAGWLVRRSRKHDAIVGRRAWLSHAGLVLAPLAALLLVRVAWSEPRFPPRLMTSPAGDPVLADDLPPGTTRLDVRYTPSVALVGSRVDKPVASAGSDVDFELIWSAGPGAPRTVGIFVHVEPPGGAAINRDHFLVSSAVELADAPAGKLLRDHVAIAVPPGAKRGTWTVWAGLWHARGDQALLPIQSPGSAEVVGGRVKAGTFEVR